jgi:uncharacterized phage protein (TIGR01671 family)
MSTQRTIKFRVWDVHNGKMIDPDRWGNDLVMDMDGELKWYKEHSYQGGMLDISGTASLVLMQYTGLNDKAGQEIYEGDVVENHHPEKTSGIYIVRFSLSDFGTRFEIVNHTTGLNRWWKEATCRIIGNIYENPELLNQ